MTAQLSQITDPETNFLQKSLLKPLTDNNLQSILKIVQMKEAIPLQCITLHL